MKALIPLEITAASGRLTSTTATEPSATETEWVSGATYTAGTECIRASMHRTYTRLVDGAGTIAPELDTDNWKDTGATNKWAMFDLNSNQQTALASPLPVAIAPGQRITAIGLTGIEAYSVSIVQTVGATVHYTTTIATQERNVLNWLDYLLAEFRYTPALAMFDIPPISGSTITITFTGGTVKCGRVFVGGEVYMGTATEDAESDIINTSKTERDTDNKATLIPRPTVPKANLVVISDKMLVNTLRALRVDSNARVILWSALDDDITSDWFDAFLIPGFWKTFTIRPFDATQSKTTLQLEQV